MLLSLRPAPSVVAWPTVARPPTRLERCLLLALLIHGLLVAWLGSAPGSARPGEGLWGRIQVTLRGESGPTREGGDSAATSQASSDPAAPRSTPRVGGRVRSEAPPADAAPGAARLGETNPSRAEEQLSRLADTAPGGQLQPLPREKLASSSLDASNPALAPLPPTPQPVLRGQLSAPAPSPLQKLQPLPSSTPLAAAAPALAPVTRPIVNLAAPVLKALPGALPQATAVSTQALPELAAPARPVSRLSEAAPPAPVSKPLPALPSTVQPADTALPALPQAPNPVGSLSTPVAAPALSKPLPSLPTPVQARTAPTLAPLPEVAQPGPEPAQTAASPSTQPSPQPAAETATPATASPNPSPKSTPSLSEAPQRLVTSPGASNAPAVGAPDAGSRVGADLALPPAPGASAPKLDLSLPRAGGPLARQGVKGMLSVLPVPPDKKSKLEQEMEAAKRADCRRAYEQAGILAVVPLALDAARGKGCRW